jgi:hypothetical protein
MIRGAVSMVVVVASLATAGAQAADAPERVSLRWNAPDTCPDDAQLVRAVEGFLGQPLVESREQQLSVSVNVQAGPGGFAAKLSFKSPGGTQERFLEHPECSKLTEGVALLAALAIDPERVKARQASVDTTGTSEPPPDPASASPRPEAPVVPSTPPTPVVVCPAPSTTPTKVSRGTLSAAVFMGIGTLPGATPGVATEAGWRVRRFRAAVLGRYWLSSSADVVSTAPRSIELSLATVGLRACVLPVVGAWSWLACAGADLGDMAGSGQGVDNARTQHALFGAAEASFSLAYTRYELAPFIGLGASLSLARPRFGVVRNGGPDETFRPSLVGGLVNFGLVYGL